MFDKSTKIEAAQMELEARKTDQMLRTLFTYLSAPYDSCTVKVTDLCELLKIVVSAIDA